MPVEVLFVCMGNICRSPSAEGVFRHLVRQAGLEADILTDSAGTHSYHVGNGPDPRSQQHALKREIDISDLRARQVCAEDFRRFDYLFAMDRENLDGMFRVCPPEYRDKVALFLSLAPELETEEVPDPYYGGVKGFEHVLDLVETASERLLEKICREHGLQAQAV